MHGNYLPIFIISGVLARYWQKRFIMKHAEKIFLAAIFTSLVLFYSVAVMIIG